MISAASDRHRLEGLEPDNLLAFLALLGLLRALEAERPEWFPRTAWEIDNPPLRPVLVLAAAADRETICTAAAAGIAACVAGVDFGSAGDLKLDAATARALLCRAVTNRAGVGGTYFADLCAALFSDGALSRDSSRTAPTLLAYDSVARINFLEGFKTLAAADLPEKKNRGRDPKYPKNAAESIYRTLFAEWERLDRPPGLRWDPEEAKRHAYRWNAPTDEQPKTQHGANRLALVGLATLTAAPVSSAGHVLLAVSGAQDSGNAFSIAWPIWRAPASLAAIRALLSHPKLRTPHALDHLGVDHVRIARRISLGKYRNFTDAEPRP